MIKVRWTVGNKQKKPWLEGAMPILWIIHLVVQSHNILINEENEAIVMDCSAVSTHLAWPWSGK